MERIIVHPAKYECPFCHSISETYFETAHYEGGSSGYRTVYCPQCGKELSE